MGTALFCSPADREQGPCHFCHLLLGRGRWAALAWAREDAGAAGRAQPQHPPPAGGQQHRKARAERHFQRHNDINFTSESLCQAQRKMAQNFNTSSAFLTYQAVTEIHLQTE